MCVCVCVCDTHYCAHTQVYHNVAPEPTMACIRDGVKAIEIYKPDVIIGMVGGCVSCVGGLGWGWG